VFLCASHGWKFDARGQINSRHRGGIGKRARKIRYVDPACCAQIDRTTIRVGPNRRSQKFLDILRLDSIEVVRRHVVPSVSALRSSWSLRRASSTKLFPDKAVTRKLKSSVVIHRSTSSTSHAGLATPL
jgi:hypothetical protein